MEKDLLLIDKRVSKGPVSKETFFSLLLLRSKTCKYFLFVKAEGTSEMALKLRLSETKFGRSNNKDTSVIPFLERSYIQMKMSLVISMKR